MSERNSGRTTSNYEGVMGRHGRFLAHVALSGVRHHAGWWTQEADAALARDRLVLHLGLDDKKSLHFPRKSKRLGARSAEQLQALAKEDLRTTQASQKSSAFRGVWWDARRQLWSAQLKAEKRRAALGRFAVEADAARAYDDAAWNALGPDVELNFKRPGTTPTGKWPERRAAKKRSRYRGLHAKGEGHQAMLEFRGERMNLGAWSTQKAAAIAVDRALLHFGLEDRGLNLKSASVSAGAASPSVLRRLARQAQKKTASSQYFGVKTSHAGWASEILVERGRMIPIGHYRSEVEAAAARDRAWLHFGYDRSLLNFPRRRLRPASVDELRKEARAEFKKHTTSQYRGVYENHRTGRWVARIRAHGVLHHLGTFDVERDAAEAYDRAALRLLGSAATLNFSG